MGKSKQSNPNSPFAGLEGLRETLKKSEVKAPTSTAPQKQLQRPQQKTESDLLAEAMQGVKPLDHRISPPQRKRKVILRDQDQSEENEVVQELEDLVSGKVPFDWGDFACQNGVDAAIWR